MRFLSLSIICGTRWVVRFTPQYTMDGFLPRLVVVETTIHQSHPLINDVQHSRRTNRTRNKNGQFGSLTTQFHIKEVSGMRISPCALEGISSKPPMVTFENRFVSSSCAPVRFVTVFFNPIVSNLREARRPPQLLHSTETRKTRN